MATYLYCLFQDRVDPPAELRGVAGALLRPIDAGPLRAWVETTTASPAATPESLAVHDAVTRAGLATGSTPVPARFGEVFQSDVDCASSLANRTPELQQLLARVAGCVEMTVAIRLYATVQTEHAQPVDPENPRPGRAYLERLREERQRSQILLQQGHVLARPVINAVRHLVTDERAAVRPSPSTYLLSHLISRASVDEYRRLAQAAIGPLSATEPLRAVVRGPSAPFSFTAAHV